MKRAVDFFHRSFALIVCMTFAISSLAQSNPKLNIEVMDREREIEMALSAAPEHLRKDATVYALERSGFVKVREGTNGFSCLVNRSATETAPMCYDAEGSQTTLKADLRRAELRAKGKSEQEVENIISEEYRAKKLLAPRRPGVAYMLSNHFTRHDHTTGKTTVIFGPHVMFYAPYMKNSDIGALPSHRGSQSQPWILNEGKPNAYIIVVPKG
ncbi:MAG: hypothetical protein AB1631_14600 [Acidobacteriota bacterium]